jgi:uncharacterized membrane protein
MAALIGLFVGAIVGNLLWHEWGAAILGIVGFIIGAKLIPRRLPAAVNGSARVADGSSRAAAAAVRGDELRVADERSLRQRIDELEQRVARLERGRAERTDDEPTPPDAAADAAPWRSEPMSSEDTLAAPGIAAPAMAAAAAAEDLSRPSGHAAEATSVAAYPAAPPGKPNPIWAWFTGGNTLTRIGVVVLFFGVAFLLRYFAEHFTMPIEMRLAAVAVGGFALIAIGVALGRSRPGYGLSLEGAGAGVLYLTTYAAFRMYGVLPETATIALLVAVSALTIGLALRNDSQPLAGLAIAGGFLAPMLVATEGEPIHLFGYFAVLNGAIFALAWTRAWRALNALGFVFTFVLAAVWGYGYFRPDHYAVVQPFLVLFFAFYVTIAILYARRGPLVAKDPVDGLLVFGVPLAGFALQAAIVGDTRYGAAISAVAVALIYALLGFALKKRSAPGFALLSRAFQALSVIFATIAVPYFFDKRATAALWAVEGAGVYWIAVRQQARFARVFALLVEVGSGMLFVASGVGNSDDRLFANAFFIGATLIGISGLVIARIADRGGDALSGAERETTGALFVWGVLWWLAGGGFDLVRQLPRAEAIHAVLAWVTISVAAALALSRGLRWPRLAAAGATLLPTIAGAAYCDFELARTTLAVYGWIVFPCAWVVHGQVLRAADATRAGAVPSPRASFDVGAWLPTAHTVSALMLVAQIAWEASEWTGRATALRTVWTPCAAALPAIAFLALCVRFREGEFWPATPYRDAYARGAGTPIAGLLTVWFFAVNLLSPGDPSPLRYWPLANPLDLTLCAALGVLFVWARSFAGLSERALYRWTGAALFVGLNGVVLRTAHHWAGIPWRVAAMLASKPLQAALTLTWTVTALALMYAATKRRLRPLWMLGAALLAVVVGKLFIVDLGTLSGLPRVVAFLGVGLLLLVIGFLSPLPPAARTDEASAVRSPPT